MRKLVAIVTIVAVQGLGGAAPARAQTPRTIYGMFGSRTLAAPITPSLSPSRFAAGAIVQGPAGDFYGISAYHRALMFPGMPWQYPTPENQGPNPVVLGLQTRVNSPIPPTRTITGAPAGQPPTEPEIPPPTEPGIAPQTPPVEQPIREAAEVPPVEQPVAGPQWVRTPLAPTEAPPAPGTAPVTTTGPVTTTVQRPIMPPTMQLGFQGPEVSSRAAVEIADQITRASQIQKLGPIAVTVQGDTAVLRGVVASEHDRRLAGDLASLEPGVWHVRNELSVATPSPPATFSPRH